MREHPLASRITRSEINSFLTTLKRPPRSPKWSIARKVKRLVELYYIRSADLASFINFSFSAILRAWSKPLDNWIKHDLCIPNVTKRQSLSYSFGAYHFPLSPVLELSWRRWGGSMIIDSLGNAQSPRSGYESTMRFMASLTGSWAWWRRMSPPHLSKWLCYTKMVSARETLNLKS